jgi:hypothetical protein
MGKGKWYRVVEPIHNPSSNVNSLQSSLLEQRSTQQCTTEKTGCDRKTCTSAVAVTIRPAIRCSRSDDPHVRVGIRSLGVGIVAVRSSRCIWSPGWLDVYISALLVLAEELGLSGLDGAHERLSCTQMSEVCLSFLLCATDTVLFALFVSLASDLVLQLARELVDTGRLRSGAWPSSSSRCLSLGRRSWRQSFVVRVFCCKVIQRHCPLHPAMLLALLWAQCAQVLFVIVRVDPYTTRWIGCGVDEELMALLWVEGTHPAGRQLTHLIFHRAPSFRWNSIAFCSVARSVSRHAMDARFGC